MAQPSAQPCPRCGTAPRISTARFCSQCGLPFWGGAGPSTSPIPALPIGYHTPPAIRTASGDHAKSNGREGCLVFAILMVVAVFVVGTCVSQRSGTRPVAVQQPVSHSFVEIPANQLPAYTPNVALPAAIGPRPEPTWSNAVAETSTGASSDMVRVRATIDTAGYSRLRVGLYLFSEYHRVSAIDSTLDHMKGLEFRPSPGSVSLPASIQIESTIPLPRIRTAFPRRVDLVIFDDAGNLLSTTPIRIQ